MSPTLGAGVRSNARGDYCIPCEVHLCRRTMLSQHSSVTATINTPMGIALSMPSHHRVRLLFTHLCPTD